MAQSRQSKARVLPFILVGVLIGIIGTVGFLYYLAIPTAPNDHTNIVKSITVFYRWPTTPNSDIFLIPKLLSTTSGAVGTQLNVVDIHDYILRARFYSISMPESIWSWSLNGTTVAMMHIIGPLTVYQSYGPVWFVEISRLTMAQLTLYLPDGTTEIMSEAFGSTTPVVGYSPHFYNLTSAGYYNEVQP